LSATKQAADAALQEAEQTSAAEAAVVSEQGKLECVCVALLVVQIESETVDCMSRF